MNKYFKFPGLLILSFILSCTNTENEISPMIPSSDTKIILTRYPVANFDNWKFIYLLHDSLRRAYGISHYVAGEGIDDSSLVVVFDIIDDTTKVSEYAALPEIQQSRERAGLIGDVKMDKIQLIRDDSSFTEVNDRVLVQYKVKDFDAWLKEFDKKGMNTRKANGLVDRGVGRGMDDPNMVYTFFAVTDWAKVNERLASDELKKIFTEAGVETAPTIVRYSLKF